MFKLNQVTPIIDFINVSVISYECMLININNINTYNSFKVLALFI